MIAHEKEGRISASTLESPVVLFDGRCGFCSASVQFIATRDPHQRFRFAPLQSQAAEAMLAPFHLQQHEAESLIVVLGERYWTQSEALVRIATDLRFPWSLIGWISRLVPRPIRDYLYRAFARRRYRWFGRLETCMTPTPELAARFVPEPSVSGSAKPSVPGSGWDRTGPEAPPRRRESLSD